MSGFRWRNGLQSYQMKETANRTQLANCNPSLLRHKLGSLKSPKLRETFSTNGQMVVVLMGGRTAVVLADRGMHPDEITGPVVGVMILSHLTLMQYVPTVDRTIALPYNYYI